MPDLAALPNPFQSSITATPWEERFVDVEGIHRGVFDACCAAADLVREGESAGVLIQGRPGSGKTHLLGRLRRHLAAPQLVRDVAAPALAFVWVRLNTNPRWLWRHVRQNLVDDLLKRLPDELTQLEHLLAMRVAAVAGGEGDLARWWEYVREERPEAVQEALDEIADQAGLTHDFVTVLDHWIRQSQRRLCRSWLRGESLPESALASLGLAPEPGGEADHDSWEQRAREAVVALCRLAGRWMPIVFCLDQIEALQVSLDDQAGIDELGDLVRELHDCRNTVVISCVQTEYFKSIRDRLKGYARDAMVSFGSKSLNPLLFDDAVALVAARLQSVPQLPGARPAGANDLWPLSDDEIRGFVGESGRSPRELLNYCAGRFRSYQGAVPKESRPLEEVLQSIWEERWEQAVEANSPEQSEQILADGLPSLVDVACAGWTVRQDPHERDLDFVLEGLNNEARVGVSLCAQSHMTSLAARLRRLRERVKRKDLQKLVMIRDGRTPISSGARRTREHLDELTADSSHVLLRADAAVLSALDALRNLLADAQAGDLAIEGDAVAPATLREWFIAHLAQPLRELSEQLVGYPAPVEDWAEDDALADRVIELLGTQRVVPLSAVARELGCDPAALERLSQTGDERWGYISGDEPVLFEMVAG